MPQSKKRGGKKAHNKRVQKRKQEMQEILKLRKKIFEEAKERFLKEQMEKKEEQDKQLIQIKLDDTRD